MVIGNDCPLFSVLNSVIGLNYKDGLGGQWVWPLVNKGTTSGSMRCAAEQSAHGQPAPWLNEPCRQDNAELLVHMWRLTSLLMDQSVPNWIVSKMSPCSVQVYVEGFRHFLCRLSTASKFKVCLKLNGLLSDKFFFKLQIKQRGWNLKTKHTTPLDCHKSSLNSWTCQSPFDLVSSSQSVINHLNCNKKHQILPSNPRCYPKLSNVYPLICRSIHSMCN